MKRSTVLALLLLALAAPAARADGLPVLGIDAGPSGVASLSGNARYVTLSAGQNTMLARVDPRTGHVLTWRMLHGSWTIPAVAYDWSASGLSADGTRLVLIEPRAAFPRERTRLMLLDLQGVELRVRRTIDLQGDFSFDAISPRGRLMYLIHYTSATDPNVYEVRRYDLETGTLAEQAVTDPDEHGTKMGGRPLSRAESRDGRWDYTLYDGNGSPFVHALDTATSRAHCIDLSMLKRKSYWLMGLRLGGGTLSVVQGRRPQIAIDLRTFTTHAPVAASRPRPSGDGFPWAPVASILGGLAVAAALAVLLRRRGAGVTRPDRSPARAS